jgi:hypothetical protein
LKPNAIDLRTDKILRVFKLEILLKVPEISLNSCGTPIEFIRKAFKEIFKKIKINQTELF